MLAFVIPNWIPEIPVAAAAGIIALIGYAFGRRSRPQPKDRLAARRELKRAQVIIRELEQVAQSIRLHLAQHHSSVVQFQDRLDLLSRAPQGADWAKFTEEAERLLRPTQALASQIAYAYEGIRQQTNLLMNFSDVRTDPLTGAGNRRALDETLAQLLAQHNRYRAPCSVVIFDVDFFKQINDQHGHQHGDQVLQQLVSLMEQSIRETDTIARFGGEEFVLLLPHTDLPGACILAERIRKTVAAILSVTISGGAAAAAKGDDPQTLLSRADTALYSAKTAGRNRIYQHSGATLSPVTPPTIGPPHLAAPQDPATDAGSLEIAEPEFSTTAG